MRTKTGAGCTVRIALIAAGVVLFFLLLEAGMRVAGFTILFLQESGNRKELARKGVYRIMCIGESTTQGQYPPFLEEILNERSRGLRFSVIDKGKAATTTPSILGQIDSYLDEYKPDAVVAMMGINDDNTYMISEPAGLPASVSWLRQFKAYKLFRYICLHWQAKAAQTGLPAKAQSPKNHHVTAQGAGSVIERKAIPGSLEANCSHIEAYCNSGFRVLEKRDFPAAESIFLKATQLCPGFTQPYFGLMVSYRAQGKLAEAEEAFRTYVSLDQDNADIYNEAGFLYYQKGDLEQATSLFLHALELNPGAVRAYLGLAVCYKAQSRFREANEVVEQCIRLAPDNAEAYTEKGFVFLYLVELTRARALFVKAIELDPRSDHAYRGLGLVCRAQMEFSDSEAFFKKAIEINPLAGGSYSALADLYRELGRFFEAEDCLQRFVALEPDNAEAHVQLGWFYFEQDNYARAREVFARALRVNPRQDSAYVGLAYTARDLGRLSEARDFAVKAVELNPGNKHACAALSGVYARMGQYDAAMEYSQKVNNLDSTWFRPVTVNSYRLLKEKLDTRGIRLICVQYPMRSVAALMNIFENKTGVIFVDNEESFKQLVRDAGVKQVFRDLFAGDFGHCTDKGNRLLAQNIAEAILKAVGSAAR